MELLENLIKSEGKVINSKILKVDSFLNHQIDPGLMYKIGEDFYQHFKNQSVTKILTIEASGIACAVMTAFHFNVPLIFAKKQKPSTLVDSVYKRNVFSFTKNKEYEICISKEFLRKDDRILIIDDFLANGNALNALNEIIIEAEAVNCGAGIVIEKLFQNGRNNIKDRTFEIYSLAIINSLANNEISFFKGNQEY